METEPRWAMDNHVEAPTQGNLGIRLETASNTPVAFTVVSLEDGAVVATGTHPGTGTLNIPVPPVFDALPGRTFVLGGGQLRSEYVTPIVYYGQVYDTPQVQLTSDVSFRPTSLVVNTPKLFGVSAHLKRSSAATGQSLTGYTIIGFRNGAIDPIDQSGAFTLINGAVLDTFTVNFLVGEKEFDIRRHFPIPDNVGFANLVVFFQIVIDDGAGGWIVSGIKGSAIRPRVPATAASSATAPTLQTMTPSEYLEHCRCLEVAANRGTARQWLTSRNANARSQLVQLRLQMNQ